jgi:hypothetical protein
MQECLLAIILTPALEEDLVDWLLGQEHLSGFSSMPISGHGTGQTALSIAEQVTGRQRKVMFHVHGSESILRDVLADLKVNFKGTGIHYWLMPLLEGGHLD